jgi:nucleotide-binding universal stress UspA family protein
MKTILVPTDFSPSANNAMKYAAQLAQTVDASLLLVHVYQIPISMNDVPVMMVSVEELKNNADKGLERCREDLLRDFSFIDIKTESRLGDVVEELKDLCSRVNPFAIVVGKHGASGVERFLFGSTTQSIIRHLHYPVISVPESATAFQPGNVALAVDDSDASLQENKIKEFLQDLKSRVHVVHIQEGGKDSPNLKGFLSGLHPVYETIRNNEFVQGIEQYVRTHSIDMLMIFPHKHGFVERLFFKTHTAELVEKLRVPIVCIPGT